MEKLAIEGGKPVRNELIKYGHQWIDDDDIDAVKRVLSSDFIVCGPMADKLAERLVNYTNAKYASVVSSGTAALHCAVMAAGIKAGDEVITTPLTFAASANCALYCGARPIFADVDMETYNIDPHSIEANITDRTKAIVAVDFTGQAVRIREIREICDRYGLVFIEDAAHSIGTEYEGKPVGSLADLTCFSFHPVKTITSGEGGAVTTNNYALYHKIELLHMQGMEHDERYMMDLPHEGPWYYEQTILGYNYRMTDFQAALLLSQFGKLEKFKARRKKIVQRYNEAFKDLPEIIIQKEIPESDTCRHLYIIRLNLDKLKCTRRQFHDALVAENVQPQIHYIPVYWFPYYRHLGYQKGLCPNAEEIYRGIMSLPLFPKMTDRDVEDVINAIRKVVGYYRK